MGKKVWVVFLWVLENSCFAEVKAECVRVLYGVLFRRGTLAMQEEISYRIARALWRIS